MSTTNIRLLDERLRNFESDTRCTHVLFGFLFGMCLSLLVYCTYEISVIGTKLDSAVVMEVPNE